MATGNARKQIISVFIIVAVLAVLYGIWSRHNVTSQKNAAPPELLSGTIFPQARPVEAFSLTNDDNQPLTTDNLKGHWTFVFFGFTHCPSLCPTTLSTLTQAYKQLQTAHQEPMPQVLFISVDPERDSLATIKDYLAGFNPAFLGATGSKETIDAMTQGFNVMYAKVFPDGDKTYTIDHSGTIILLDPNAEVYAVFSTPHKADNIAKDFVTIVNYYTKISS